MKRLMVLCIAAMLLIAVPAIAGNTDRMTGNKLKEYAYSSTEKNVADAFFHGYVQGVFESDMLLCVPNGVTVGQLGDVVKKYMKDHPDKLHLEAPAIVRGAIYEAWPNCK